VKKFVAIGAGFLLGACATGAPVTPTQEAAAALPPEPAAPVYVASDFAGKTVDAIEARLGPAALVRREGDGEYRRYSLAACTLIVILYPNEMGQRRARHLDATALVSGQEKPALEACLAEG